MDHYLRIESEVTVEPSCDTIVPLIASPGGRLNLTLSVADLKAGDASFNAEVELIKADGTWAEELKSFYVKRGLEFSWSTGIIPNEAALSASAFAPGSYRVRVLALGFEPMEALVIISEGEISDVTIELFRRG